MLAGDMDTSKTVVRDYINATIGFNELAEGVKSSPKSLMRMLRPRGNPQARNLFRILAYLIRSESIRLELRTAAARG